MRPLEKYLEIWYFFLAEWWIDSSIKIDRNPLNRSILKNYTAVLSFLTHFQNKLFQSLLY